MTTNDLRKSGLSQPRQRLVEFLNAVHFGRIEGLVVRQGEPGLSPRPRVVRAFKFGGGQPLAAPPAPGDFLLKAHHRDLLRCLDQVGDSVLACLEVKHGLPFHLLVEEPLAGSLTQPE